MQKNNNRYLLTHLKSRIDSLLTNKLTWNSAKIMWIFVALANTCNNSYHERYMVNQTQSPYGIIQNVVIIPKKEFKIIYCTNIYKGYLSSKDSKWMKFLLAFRPPCSVGKIIFFKTTFISSFKKSSCFRQCKMIKNSFHRLIIQQPISNLTTNVYLGYPQARNSKVSNRWHDSNISNWNNFIALVPGYFFFPVV